VAQIGGTTQYQQALFDVIRVLATTTLELGTPGAVMRARLTAVRHTAVAAGNSEAIEMLDHLIDDLFPAIEENPKPPFRIV